MAENYLIALSIGPVQDFIAAARRTRDLWFGSYLLSEVSKAAARSLQDSKAELIFPSPDTDLIADSAANVGNKLLVLLETKEPQSAIQQAKESAQQRWVELANDCKRHLSLNETIWSAQLCDVLEFFSAWVLLEKIEDYGAPLEQGKGRRRLEQLLNARKNTREFSVNPVQGQSIPKSSLDGLRESVLSQTMKQWQKYRLGLSIGEELDCIGVVKRIGGKNPGQFTPLSRLAIDPWLRYTEKQGIELETLTDTLGELMVTDLGLVSGVTGNQQVYNVFPYDGQLLYDFRIQAEINSLKGVLKDAEADISEQVDHAKNQLERLIEIFKETPLKDLPKPTPYMAILAADGDRMGELLDSMDSILKHQDISAKLATFATQVPQTIRKFYGHCVYAGGDDVLALLPLDTALACAHQLATEFNEIMMSIDGIDQNDDLPTLSVGLGVSHFLTPMGKQLELARRAEHLAKSNHLSEGRKKNALAILLQPRSGAEISFRERWDNEVLPHLLLGKWIQAHNQGLLPKGFGYELRQLSFALDWCTDTAVIEKEISRILERKRQSNGEYVEEGLIADICKRAAQAGLKLMANELIITHRFAQAYQLSGQQVPGQLQ